jgi:hypothetical protein
MTPRAGLALRPQASLLRRVLATCATAVKSELLYLCKQALVQSFSPPNPPTTAFFRVQSTGQPPAADHWAIPA